MKYFWFCAGLFWLHCGLACKDMGSNLLVNRRGKGAPTDPAKLESSAGLYTPLESPPHDPGKMSIQRTVPIPKGSTAAQIKDIIMKADQSKPVDQDGMTLVQFPAGEVFRLKGNERESAVVLSGIKNMVIDGNGATIVMDNDFDSGFLDLNSCENIVVKRFKVNFDPAPFTQGRIIRKISNKVFVVEIEKGFHELNEPPFDAASGPKDAVSNAFVRNSQVPTISKRGVLNQLVVSNWEKSSEGNRRWIITFQTEEPAVEVGDAYVQYKRTGYEDPSRPMGMDFSKGPAVIKSVLSNHISMVDNTVYAGMQFGITAWAGHDLYFLNNKVIPYPNRYMSVAADGINVMGGYNVWIEGSEVRSNGDDQISFFPADTGDAFKLGIIKDKELIGRTKNVVVLNNLVSGGRRIGILLSANTGKITGNRIFNTGANGAKLGGNDLIFENNTLNNIYVARIRNDEWSYEGVINLCGKATQEHAVFCSNITVKNNTINRWHFVNGLTVYRVKGAEVSGNVFKKAIDLGSNRLRFGMIVDNSGSENISLIQNSFDALLYDSIKGGPQSAISIDATVERQVTENGNVLAEPE